MQKACYREYTKVLYCQCECLIFTIPNKFQNSNGPYWKHQSQQTKQKCTHRHTKSKDTSSSSKEEESSLKKNVEKK